MERKKKKRKVTYHSGNFKKNDPSHNVLVAIAKWVKANGGRLVLVGGIEIQDWDEGLGKFRVAVRCLGRKPEKPNAD